MSIEEIYKRKGLKYKPLPSNLPLGSSPTSPLNSTQQLVEGIKAKRVHSEKMKQFEGYQKETEGYYNKAIKKSKWQSILWETLKPSSLVNAAPVMFEKLVTPEGVKSMGRGLIKGVTLGYVAPKTPQEADEVEKAIEAGWEMAGYLVPFVGVEAGLNLAFKTPVIAAKLGKAAPYISRSTAWLGTSQLHADLRGASFEERAKRAAIDAATLLAAEGIGYGLSKGVSKLKTMTKITPALQRKGIGFFQHDLTMKFGKTGMDIPVLSNYAKTLDLSKAKTVSQAVKIFKTSLPKQYVNSPSVTKALNEAVGTINSTIFEIPSHTPVAEIPPARVGESERIKMPKSLKVSREAEINALKRIQKEFPGIKSLNRKVKDLELKVKIKAKPTETKIPKELEPLVKEARKYKSADELREALRNRPKLFNKVREEFAEYEKIPKGEFGSEMGAIRMINDPFADFYNQAVKGVKKAKPIVKIIKGVKPPKIIRAGKPKTPTVYEMAYTAKKFKTPTPKIIREETAKIVKRSEIAKVLSEKLDVPIKHGKFTLGWGHKATGIYKVKPEIIRVKEGGIPTISHEAGHHISKNIPELVKRMNTEEMVNLLMEYGGKPKGKKAREEAFAEFMRYYITEPSKAKSRAPEFLRYFKGTMEEKYPEIRDVILTARRNYMRWTEMPAVSKVLSQISMKQTKAGLKERIAGRVEGLYTTVKDDLYPLKQFSNLAKESLGNIPKEELPYTMARLVRGWVGKANVFLEKGTFRRKFWTTENGKIVPVFRGKGLKEILHPLEKKGALEDFSVYLTSKRVIELHNRGIKTGISFLDSKVAVSDLTKKHPEFTKISQEVYKFQDDVLMYGYDCGLFDKTTLAKIKALNQTYVPFYRVFEEMQFHGHLGKTLANIAKPIKRIRGSERDIINPLESIVKNTYAIINASERNSIGVMMANLSIRNKGLGRLFEKISVPMANVAKINPKSLGIDFTDKTTGEIVNKIIDIFRPSLFLPKDNVLTVLMGGKKMYFQVDPMLYKSMMSIERGETGLLVRMLSKPTSWLRAGAILSPEFMIRNPLRDVMSAFVYSKYGFLTPIDFVKGLFSVVKEDKDYWMWRMSGGEHSMFVSMDRDYLNKSFDEVVKGESLVHYFKHPLESLRIFSELSETPTRLGEFKKGIARMKSPIEAGYASREVTLDFAKMGATGNVLNRLCAFSNANFESWDKLVREFKHHPSRTTTKAVLGITLPSIMLYMINRKDSRWKEIPRWQKDLFWIIMTEKHIYRIPKPFELGLLFGSVPERVLEYIENKDPKAMSELAKTTLLTSSPDLLPTAIKPIIENWTNYNFFLEKPIVPTGRKALPSESQYTTWTSETAKKLGKIAHYSPAKIDNLFRGYFAGLGRYTIEEIDKILIGTGISSTIKPELPLSERPIVRTFVVRRPIGSASESVNSFYEKYKRIESKEKMMKEFLQNNEVKDFYAYKNKYPEVFLAFDWQRSSFYSISARYYRKVASQISELRKNERQVYASKTLNPVEKRKKITEIDKLITKIAQEALKFKLK